MSDLDVLYTALRNADAAGDNEGAARLANYIKSYSPRQPVQNFDVMADNSLVPSDSQEAKDAISPVSDNPVENSIAGAQQAVVNFGRGIGQRVGLVSKDDIRRARELDAPLDKTFAAKAGNFVGNAAMMLPASFIPGVNSVAGASAFGALTGFLQPTTSNSETATNTALGGVLGGVGSVLGPKIANAVGNRLASRQAAASSLEQLNSARDAILKEARSAGYVVPLTAVNPNLINTAVESTSGNAATRQVAIHRNALATNAGTRFDLGIPTNTPLTKEVFAGVRKREGKIYEAIKGLGPFKSDDQYLQEIRSLPQVANELEEAYPGIGAQSTQKLVNLRDSLDVPSHTAESAVELYKLLNNRSKDAFAAYEGDPEQLALARGLRSAADSVGDLLERRMARTYAGTGPAQAWSNARTIIAKSYAAEGALRGNNVSNAILARGMQAGKPVSGRMGTAAKFADQFPEVSGVPKSGAGVSKLMATLGEGGVLAGVLTHHPEIAAASVAAAAAPYVVRKAILSGAGQRLMATPSYEPNALGTLGLNALRSIANNPVPSLLAPLNSLYVGQQ